MSNEHEIELLRRRDEILRETAELTSNIVQSLEQQQQFAHETKENLHNQNFLLSLANDKMRSMNEDLNSVVHEMNEIDAQDGCLCCRWRKKKTKKKEKTTTAKVNPSSLIEKTTIEASKVPGLVNDNEQEKLIVQELALMQTQLVVFQDQVKTINRSFVEGDEIIQQLNNESNQYMNASSCSFVVEKIIISFFVSVTTALNKAEDVLGRKFIVNQDEQQVKAHESNKI